MNWPDAFAFSLAVICFLLYLCVGITGRYPWDKR